jgi:hypothetical protein
VRLQLIIGILITILVPSALSAQAPDAAAQDIGKMEQVLKEAGELQSSRPQAVAEKLAPLLAELRQLRQNGALAQDGARILGDALVLLMRTQIMLLLPEAQITPLAHELLTTNPGIDVSNFNPREKLLLEKIRTAEMGRLVLQTTPPGVTLSYLGTELSKTPAEIPLISGIYRFRLRLEGYLDQDFDTTVQPSEIVTETRTLRRRTVEIPVAIGAPAVTITLNGKSLGISQGYNAWLASLPPDNRPEWAAVIQQWKLDSASFSFFRLQDIPVGEGQKIEFQAACYQTAALQFMVQESDVDWTRPLVVRPELRRVELKRDTGFLEVSSAPSGAEVWLDGVSQGLTPMGKDVCVGTHRVQIWHRSGQYVQEANIRRGQASKIAGDLKPALAFLGVFSLNPQNNQAAPLSADWEAVSRRIALRGTAFVDPRIAQEDIDAMRKKGVLPIEELCKDGSNAAATDMLIRNISAETGRADLLLVGLRAENRYIFRLYSTIHPIPDLIEIPALDEASLDFLIAQLNNTGKVADRLWAVDVGIEMLDTPKGLMILKTAAGVAAGKTGLAPGSIVRSVDEKPMNLRELQGYLRTKKSGQTITLEVQAGKEPAVLVPVAIRLSGTEYPWNTPDGFANSVLAVLRHLVERDPLSEQAKYAGLSLARGLMRQREWRLALELLAKTNLEPHKTGICPGTVLYYQGRCLEEMGESAQAESYYTRAKDYSDATIGMPGGPAVPVLAEQRIQSLKKLPGVTPGGTGPERR